MNLRSTPHPSVQGFNERIVSGNSLPVRRSEGEEFARNSSVTTSCDSTNDGLGFTLSLSEGRGPG
jgi:hypothetical protein